MLKSLTKLLLPFILILVYSNSGFAQGYKVSGKVLDRFDQSPLVGAIIVISNALDSTDRRITITNIEGRYSVAGLSKKLYKLSASYMGYNKLDQKLIVSFRNQVVDNIALNPIVQQLNQVTIIGTPPPAVLRGDTSEYNASSFKVTADANVEDLVKKMPGVTIEDGVVKTQGEDVKKLLVDGKPFFGDDASVALKNLPAELVEKVQVFDQVSEQSQLSGFNDGQTTKTMNIITRSNKRNGQFGKLTAAYGDKDLYQVGVSMNKFKGAQRLSVIGTTNNINQQNFATQDFLGAMGGNSSFGGGGGGGNRGGGGGGRDRGQGGGYGSSRQGGNIGNFMGGNQSGFNTVNSIGINYSNTLNEKLTVSGSYFFNNNNNTNDQISNTEFIQKTDSSRIEDSNSHSSSVNYNNRLNFRVEYLIDTMNTLILIPSVNFQSNTSNSNNIENTSSRYLGNETQQINSNYTNNSKTTGYNISNRITFRHKFVKVGRTASIDLNATFNEREPYNNSHSKVYYFKNDSTATNDPINSTVNSGYTVNTNVAYTEPIGKIGQLQINASNSYAKNYSYRQTYDSLELEEYKVDTLSNKYLNYFIANRLGLSYRIKTIKLAASAGAEVQNADLSGDQIFPDTAKTDKQFINFLPNAQFNYRLTQQTNFLVNYNTSTNPPSITQLQNVADKAASGTRTTYGNPDLSPQYTHSITTRITHVNREKGSNFFLLFGGSINQNSIGNDTRTENNYTTVRYINKGTGYNLRSMTNYGFPIKLIKCNLNISGGYNYNRTPGKINGKDNISSTNTLTHSEVLSSNISEKLDFTVSVNGNYNIVANTVSTTNNNDYYSQNSSFRFNWIFWKNFTFQNDITNRLYRGITTSDNDMNLWVINLGLGKKFLKNQAAEFRVSVYDLFNKNTSYNTSINGNAITNSQSKILSRYVMASFIYTFRAFKSGSAPQQQDRRRRDDSEGPHFHD